MAILLYGDVFLPKEEIDYSTGFRDAITINFRNGIVGNNAITAKANSWTTQVMNFTVKTCL